MILYIKVRIDNDEYEIPYDSNISYLIMIYNQRHDIKINKLYNKYGKPMLDIIPIRGYCIFNTGELAQALRQGRPHSHS